MATMIYAKHLTNTKINKDHTRGPFVHLFSNTFPCEFHQPVDFVHSVPLQNGGQERRKVVSYSKHEFAPQGQSSPYLLGFLLCHVFCICISHWCKHYNTCINNTLVLPVRTLVYNMHHYHGIHKLYSNVAPTCFYELWVMLQANRFWGSRINLPASRCGM